MPTFHMNRSSSLALMVNPSIGSDFKFFSSVANVRVALDDEAMND